LGSSRFSTELMQCCGPAAGAGPAERVRNILGNSNSLPAVAQGLFGVA
jgi:hypothetical protein